MFIAQTNKKVLPVIRLAFTDTIPIIILYLDIIVKQFVKI